MKDRTKFYLKFQDHSVLVQVPSALESRYYQFRDESGHCIYTYSLSYQSALSEYFSVYPENKLSSVIQLQINEYPPEKSILCIPFNILDQKNFSFLQAFVPFYRSLRTSIQYYLEVKYYNVRFVDNLLS